MTVQWRCVIHEKRIAIYSDTCTPFRRPPSIEQKHNASQHLKFLLTCVFRLLMPVLILVVVLLMVLVVILVVEAVVLVM